MLKTGRRFFRRRGGLFTLMALFSMGLTTPRAEASFVYNTAGGSTAGGQPVNATATFTITAGHVEILLTNLLSNPKSDIQTLNGIQFTLSSGQTVGSNFTSSALHRQIDSNAPNPTGWHDVGVSSTNWNLNNGVSGGIELTSIGNSGGSPTLIGGPDVATNAYLAAGGSIAGSGPHNPFLAGTATYELDISGLQANASISSMRFEFGTAGGTNVTGMLTPSVPEPSTVIMTSLGLGALGLVQRARRRKATLA
jgi:hypothetical protein